MSEYSYCGTLKLCVENIRHHFQYDAGKVGKDHFEKSGQHDQKPEFPTVTLITEYVLTGN